MHQQVIRDHLTRNGHEDATFVAHTENSGLCAMQNEALELIDATGRREKRHRSLPARTMAYFAIGLALHADGSYEDVLGLMCDGLSWANLDAGR